MKRTILLFAISVAFALAMPGAAEIAGTHFAQAQQKQKPQEQVKRRPNLLELLFGGGLRKQSLQRNQPAPKARRVVVSPNQSGNSVTSLAPVEKTIVVKSETAAKILVVGDFMADSLHWGLEQAYASNPNAVLVNKSSGLSGIVRNDVVDWPTETVKLIDELKPVAVVILVGMNDRQQMRLETGRVAKLTEPWRKEYEARVEAAVKAVRDRNLALVWLGLPPVKSGAMNPDYLVFNEIYRNKVEASGGKFVDVWDGFTNAEGQFISAGPDINGQIVRLRNADGINMTRAGMSKLAFYAEKEIRKAVGLGAETAIASLATPQGPAQILEPEYDPAGTGRTVVISLDSPQADGGDALEGATGFLSDKSAEKSMSFILVEKGVGLQPKAGRVDSLWGAASTTQVVPATPAAGQKLPAQSGASVTVQ